MHYQRWKRLGDPVAGKTYNTRGEGTIINGGYKAVAHKMVHVERAEKALGKQLPANAVVHHVDYDKENNSNDNLVICPDNSYHRLIHTRTDAYNACGNADHRKCVICKQYDDPIRMRTHMNSYVHRKCHNDYQRNRNNLSTLG